MISLYRWSDYLCNHRLQGAGGGTAGEAGPLEAPREEARNRFHPLPRSGTRSLLRCHPRHHWTDSRSLRRPEWRRDRSGPIRRVWYVSVSMLTWNTDCCVINDERIASDEFLFVNEVKRYHMSTGLAKNQVTCQVFSMQSENAGLHQTYKLIFTPALSVSTVICREGSSMLTALFPVFKWGSYLLQLMVLRTWTKWCYKFFFYSVISKMCWVCTWFWIFRRLSVT